MQFQDDREIAECLKVYQSLSPRRKILEIGSAWGDTLKMWIEHAEPKATLVSVDILFAPGDHRRDEQIRQHTEVWPALARSFGHFLSVFESSSHDPAVIEVVRGILPSVDWLFIDGDHTYEGCRADFENYAPLVRPGGIIVIHDIIGGTRPDIEHQPGVIKFWSEIRNRYRNSEIALCGGTNYGIGLLYVDENESKVKP